MRLTEGEGAAPTGDSRPIEFAHLALASLAATFAGAAILWALTDHVVLAGINAGAAAVLSAFLAGLELHAGGSLRVPRRAWIVLFGCIGVVAIVANGGLAISARGSDGLSASDVIALLPSEPEPKAVSKENKAHRRLAEAYAPVLRLSTGESFLPIGRDLYVAASDLRRVTKGSDRLVPFTRLESVLPDAACLPRCRYYLDVDGAKPSQGPGPYEAIQSELLGAKRNLTVHWQLRTYPSGAVAIQYWFLYLFNDFANRHESDWEHITVYVLPKEDGSVAPRDPDTIYYSAHEGGHKRPWKDVRKFAARPVVFVARGSHANYFEPGSPKVRPCEFPGCNLAPIRESVDGCRVVLIPAAENASTVPLKTGCKRLPQVAPYRLRRLEPPRFAGDYAKGNYVTFVKLAATYPDPQLRAQWTDPFAEMAGAAVDLSGRAG
jgi:hypothetical protein